MAIARPFRSLSLWLRSARSVCEVITVREFNSCMRSRCRDVSTISFSFSFFPPIFFLSYISISFILSLSLHPFFDRRASSLRARVHTPAQKKLHRALQQDIRRQQAEEDEKQLKERRQHTTRAFVSANSNYERTHRAVVEEQEQRERGKWILE